MVILSTDGWCKIFAWKLFGDIMFMNVPAVTINAWIDQFKSTRMESSDASVKLSARLEGKLLVRAIVLARVAVLKSI